MSSKSHPKKNPEKSSGKRNTQKREQLKSKSDDQKKNEIERNVFTTQPKPNSVGQSGVAHHKIRIAGDEHRPKIAYKQCQNYKSAPVLSNPNLGNQQPHSVFKYKAGSPPSTSGIQRNSHNQNPQHLVRPSSPASCSRVKNSRPVNFQLHRNPSYKEDDECEIRVFRGNQESPALRSDYESKQTHFSHASSYFQRPSTPNQFSRFPRQPLEQNRFPQPRGLLPLPLEQNRFPQPRGFLPHFFRPRPPLTHFNYNPNVSNFQMHRHNFPLQLMSNVNVVYERDTSNSTNNQVSSVSSTLLSKQNSAEKPTYKYTKKNNKPFKLNKKEDDSNKNKQNGNKKTGRNKRKKIDFWKQKKETTNVKPLLSFQRMPANHDVQSSLLYLEDSDEDDCVSISISQCSSHGSISGKSVSESESEESVSDESEVSAVSSIKENEIVLNDSKDNESYVSVFWDIENCSLPPNKSAADFVKAVRETFYEGRTEADFFVACDVSNLRETVLKELEEAAVMVFHVNCHKNAADLKIQSLLVSFQFKNRNTNSSIVLISGDSDFSSILYDMHYKHHILINLICSSQAKHTLTKAAHKYITFEDFLKTLPDRTKKESIQYLLVVTGFPAYKKPKHIKQFLKEKLQTVKCKVKMINNSSAEINFLDHSARERGILCMKNISFDGKLLDVTSCEKSLDEIGVSLKETQQTSKSNATILKKSFQTPDADGDKLLGSTLSPSPLITKSVTSKEISMKGNSPNISGNVFGENLNSEVSKSSQKPKQSQFLDETSKVSYASGLKSPDFEDESTACKGATLCIYVNTMLGNENYWKCEFEKLWNTSDFSLNWDGGNTDGILLVNFKSLSKAQKAKKILLKIQESNLSAPRFLKLIKQSNNLVSLNVLNDSIDRNKKKIEDYIFIIEKKRDKMLKNHQNSMSDVSNFTSQISGTEEAVRDKLRELNEQKETFLDFTSKAINKIKQLDISLENFDQAIDCVLRDFSRECNCISSALPIYAKKNFILQMIKKHQVVVIRAETGSGKSTQLTQYLWREQDPSSKGMIICTQPRKIAAISLARHVSTQVGCSVGDIVGYQVGMSEKKSPNTGILYVTDFTMLKMLVTDAMKNVSCIIIDEAHERSIYTDLLLGMIKRHLISHPHLKVVVTSATIDTSIFCNYFDLSDDCVLQVSGRTFPIEDVWLNQDVAVGWDYFKKTVETVYEILNADPGDILAFLTTPIETEKAMGLLIEKVKNRHDKKIIKIFQLHGKLDAQEQQKIFERMPPGNRKVVFSTNCAETSITIPGIKYVVDCGMVKEAQYDGVRNMSVLSVGFVSQSSAEQRRGRAGRTQVGKCYRLYSKSNYGNMETCTAPEILRINLGLALLKLMKMGVTNPLQFDFVQSPSVALLNFTMQQLIHLGAVNILDMSLSELGQQMALLPLEPRLSSLIFDGINSGIGFEALIVASLTTISRNIFFRNNENKTEADLKKKQFCDSESDFLTYFEVYKEWSEVPKQAKSKWCVLNCINARSMRIAHDLINELILTLKKEANLNIAAKYNKKPIHDILLNVIFNSFSQNICFFSGHHKIGYKSIEIEKQLMIHPSSSLYTFGRWRPEFLVYDTLLETTQTYLINVSPVTKAMLEEAVATGKLKIDLQALEALVLKSLNIAPIGEKIIVHDILGKKGLNLKVLEKKLKQVLGNNSVAIDVSVLKGEVKIFALENRFKDIESLVSPIILKAQEKLLSEQKEVQILEEAPELTAILAAGAYIKEVLLPGEFKDVKVTLKGSDEISAVIEKLQMCGNITAVREWKNYFKITFESPVDAKQAVRKYENETSFILQNMTGNAGLDGRSHLYKIFLTFLRRPCTGEAFVTLEPAAFLSIASFKLCKTIYYDRSPLRISVSKKSEDLRISGLPFDTEKHRLENLLSSFLPDDIKIKKCIIVRKKPFDNSAEEIEQMKKKLSEVFSEFSAPKQISIDLRKPSPKHFTWNAIIFFKNSHDGESAVHSLKSRKTGFLGLLLKPVLETSLYCKVEIFSAIKSQVEEALKYFKDNSDESKELDITALPKGNENVHIKITCNNISDITDARRCISDLLKGDQINCNGNSILEKLFSNGGRTYLEKLSHDNPDCYIHLNLHTKIISVFGSNTICTKIKLQINEFLNQFEDENYKEICLLSETGKAALLRDLLKKYGHHLQKLKEECGTSEIEIITHKHILVVKGTLASVTKCEAIIEGMRKTLDDSTEEGETCPICFVKVADDKHRLEYCGHAYCKECLKHLFQSSDNFPLICAFELCSSPIVLADIQWALKEIESFQKSLYHKALKYFAENRDDISFCPSPDCPMIFRVSHDHENNLFDCPVCCNSICTRCKEIYHYGMSCSLYQCCKSDDDYSLKAWMAEKPGNRKMCPKCSAPIEKNGGCNHMTCWKCKSHMCWMCLQMFPTGDLVYLHQPFCPRTADNV